MQNIKVSFLRSALGSGHEENSLTKVLSWIDGQREKVSVFLDQIPLIEIRDWLFDEACGSLRHKTGRFFSVDGVRVNTDWGPVSSWDQPIINQPEVGYLGLIAKDFKGTLHFLLQAKIEPGNLNAVQLSPTIQATKSNYTQVHGGLRPDFLDYFLRAAPKEFLLDQLQSEQGARFLRKRNRNMIILSDDEFLLPDNFIWLTLRQLKQLMKIDNCINMDTRTVISGIRYPNLGVCAADVVDGLLPARPLGVHSHELLRSIFAADEGVNALKDVFHFLSRIKSQFDINTTQKPLSRLEEWCVSDLEISRADRKYFKVIGVSVQISSREVQTWHQPMIQPAQPGLCGFVAKDFGGILHFAVQAKVECGNRDIVELAPTVQCLTGDYRLPDSEPVPFLDELLNAPASMVIHDSMQSEEGGRFYLEENRSLIVVNNDLPSLLPPQFIWLTLGQLMNLNQHNNYLNIQARSLLALIGLV